MTASTPARSRPTGRAGHGVALAVNAALLYVVDLDPGWRAAPFVTADAAAVVPWINLALVVGIVTNGVCLAVGAPWITPAGELLTTMAGMAAALRVLQMFPFDFSTATRDWTTLVHVLLIVAVVGSAIGMVAQLAVLARVLSGAGRPPRPTGG